MAIHVLPVVAGLGVAGLLAFLVMGSSGAKAPLPAKPPPPPPGKTPTQVGTEDGCAQGTADAKAGLAMAALGDAATKLAAAASASGDAPAYVAAWTAAYADCYGKTPKPITKVMPAKYKVTASDTPATVASRFGVSVDYLMAGLNGYGHGENGVRDNAPYPYHDLGGFVSTFPGLGSGAFPPVGTRFDPTFQAGHKATANLRPIFRSSQPSPGGQRYWWFAGSATPGAVPLPYSPNNSGFGRIYSDGGLFLVGPWYTGLELNVPGKPGDTSAGEGDVATSGVVVGALNAAVRAVTGRTLVGAVRMAPRAVRGGLEVRPDIAQRDAVIVCFRNNVRGDLPTMAALLWAQCAWRVVYGRIPSVMQVDHIADRINSRFAALYASVRDRNREQVMAEIAIAEVKTYASVATAGGAPRLQRRATSNPLGWPAPPR